MRHALVPVAPTDQAVPDLRATCRPNADFIAHLIATSGQAPQTRARRRAEPGEAVAVYRALDEGPTPPGRALSRSL